MSATRGMRLAPDVHRCLFVRNLPFNLTADELYDLFGKYGAIRQIRKGVDPSTRGTAFVVYEDIFDAKNACQHLSGFNVKGRYLIVLYYSEERHKTATARRKAREEELQQLKSSMDTDDM
ncbi:RRM domain-containing protein [Plasmodiophora brassicae]|uniref:RRM domain-containing protein n=1 Tax=Plasmodiophora brassicae TaxID=37360 RepID=A0A0G4J467_PLABS|nr:hypothetical protein PBRA_002389 [Plasmodiophora brassicae]SPQ93685.1 unnamed protein product [Plasmodiophora brassicae]